MRRHWKLSWKQCIFAQCNPELVIWLTLETKILTAFWSINESLLMQSWLDQDWTWPGRDRKSWHSQDVGNWMYRIVNHDVWWMSMKGQDWNHERPRWKLWPGQVFKYGLARIVNITITMNTLNMTWGSPVAFHTFSFVNIKEKLTHISPI